MARSERPRALPPFDPDCPFCPGNESLLPGIIAETRAGAGWDVRIVPNKFPALQPDARAVADLSDGLPVLGGYGFHEVIVESARHNADLAAMSDTEIHAVVSAYRSRSEYLLRQSDIAAVILFRNHGLRSGASLPHPHAQIIALPLVPPVLRELADCGSRYYRDQGRCATCDAIANERAATLRMIEESSGFLAFVPFAAATPGEIRIVPKRHRASFIEADTAELEDFTRVLRRVLGRVRRAFDDPSFNFVIDSADRAHIGAAYVHWRLRITPFLAAPGGFELGSGMAINPSAPEDDAAALRAAGDNEALP